MPSAALDLTAHSRRPLPQPKEAQVKIQGFVIVWGLIVLAIVGDVALNRSRATLFLIDEIMRLQEYLQFWH